MRCNLLSPETDEEEAVTAIDRAFGELCELPIFGVGTESYPDLLHAAPRYLAYMLRYYAETITEESHNDTGTHDLRE